MGTMEGVECAKPGCEETASATFATANQTGPDGRWYCDEHRR